MPLNLSKQAIRSTKPLPQIIIKLLQQDEPHAVSKLLNCDIVELYLLCEKLDVDAGALGQHLFSLHQQHLDRPLFD